MLYDHSNQESSIDYHTSAVQTEINFNRETFNTLYSTIHKLEEQLAQSHSTCKDLRNQLQSLISQVKKKDNLLATKNKEFHDFKEGISSFQRWASRINMRQGVLQEVLRVMQAIGLTMTDIERTTVLAFDEIKVFSLYEYDKQHDEILGPHKYMQVVMARGLFTNWKQPIFVNFDTKMTKSILMDIIDKLHTASYSVVACVSDCGGGNIGLWKELGITIEQTHFFHPITNEAVYVFADAPHLLKLIRNWFIDTGFILENGSLITKQPLEALMQQTTESEVSSCYKLTTIHLKCQKAERQNVALAAQLMSHTTATALIHYKPGLDKSLAQSTGEFIELISNWFDIMNSYSPEANVPSKKPFGSDLQFQINVLDSVYDKISTMRCITKNTLQIFQKGMLISIQSLKQLFNTLKAKYDFKYILTHRLNQDALENFFSQIRTRGGLYDHPTPIHALHRIRMIILGKNPGIVQKNLNTVEATHDEYMFVKAMKEAHISIQTENIELPVQENSDTESFSSTSTSTGNQGTIITSVLEKDRLTCVLEKDGLKYLAGWIAKKFKHKYPHLGIYSYKLHNEHIYQLPEWIQHLSVGGLTVPQDAFVKQLEELDKLFNKFHKKTIFRKGPNVTKKLIRMCIRKHPEIEKELIETFIKQRTFIRLKFQNCKLQEKLQGKRKRDQSKELQREHKVAKKMRKIVM